MTNGTCGAASGRFGGTGICDLNSRVSWRAKRAGRLASLRAHSRPTLPTSTCIPGKTVFDARELDRHNFGSQRAPALSWSRSMMLVPLNPNYARPHRRAFTPALEREWREASGAATFRFVWAAPSVASASIAHGQYLVTLDALRALCAPLLAYYRGSATHREL